MKLRDTRNLPMIERIDQEIDIYGAFLTRERIVKFDFISAGVKFQSKTQKYHATYCDCSMCRMDRDIIERITQ